MKPVLAMLLLAGLPIVALAASTKITVRNATSDPVTLSLSTAQGQQIYSPVKLGSGDRYELNDPQPGTVVHVSSAKCGSLTTDLPGRVDWTVEVRTTSKGCELTKITKSYK